MAFIKLLFTIAITIAITITIITTRTTSKTETIALEDAYKDLNPVKLRPSRFLAQKIGQEVGPKANKNPNAADHCNKDPEICQSSYYNTGSSSNSTMTCCNNKCIDVSNDANNCGTCKNKCKFSQTCCRGQCVYLAYDKRHCGECNHSCEKGEFCVYGLCNYA